MGLLDQVEKDSRTRWAVLQGQWHTACAAWNDAVRTQFEKEFWQEFEQVVPATLEEMRRLGEVIDQARREVH